TAWVMRRSRVTRTQSAGRFRQTICVAGDTAPAPHIPRGTGATADPPPQNTESKTLRRVGRQCAVSDFRRAQELPLDGSVTPENTQTDRLNGYRRSRSDPEFRRFARKPAARYPGLPGFADRAGTKAD